MFVSLALERDLIAAGRDDEVDEIHRAISTVLPEPDSERRPAKPSDVRDRRPLFSNPGPLGPKHAGQIERIYRGVYLLATLKREEMIREGQQRELDRIGEDARKSQASILKEASGSAS